MTNMCRKKSNIEVTAIPWCCFQNRQKIAEIDEKEKNHLAVRVNRGDFKLNLFGNLLGSISAALSCLVFPPREETAGRVSGKPCL